MPGWPSTALTRRLDRKPVPARRSFTIFFSALPNRSCSAGDRAAYSRRKRVNSSCVGIGLGLGLDFGLDPANSLVTHAQVPQPLIGLIVAWLAVTITQLMDQGCQQGVGGLATARRGLLDGAVLLI